MNEFNQLWANYTESQKAQLYRLAYNLIDSDKIQSIVKEEVLYKMLFLFPDAVEFYHRTALLYSINNTFKGLTWHKIGYQIDPTHAENTIAYCIALYNNGYGEQVLDLNKDKKLNKYLVNTPFLAAYTRCLCQNLHYEQGVVYLHKLIEISASKAAITQEEKYAKWQNYHDLGYVYSNLGQIDNSIKHMAKATELAVKFNLELSKQTLSFSNLLMYYCFKYNNADDADAANDLYNLYLKVNSYYPDKKPFDFSKRKCGPKIRIGYVSSDFTYHPVANFLLPILDNHTDTFDVMLFSNNANIAEIFINPKRKAFIINNISDYEAAKLIYEQKIDILIDLNGHTASNRLGVFAYNPAPIQITYLGYPNTTGLKSLKYRITDKITNPENSTEKYSEQLLYLPKCFLLYRNISSNNIYPTNTNLVTDNRKIILGALNKESKNSRETLTVWSEILKRCTNTQIFIKLASDDKITERLKYYMEKLDTTEDRLILVNRLSDKAYDTIFSKIDILLDTFPYSGTTTTCNALFNSVPVVTLYNPHNHCHSVSSSILINAELPELVAHTNAEYIEIVRRLTEPALLNMYKSTIGAKFSAMMEPKKFMESYESILSNLCKNGNLKLAAV